MSKYQIRVIAAAGLVFLAAVGFVAYRTHAAHGGAEAEARKSQLLDAEFAPGTPRQRVTAVLGEPDQEFAEAEMKRLFQPGNPECSKTASRVLRYFSPDDSVRSYCAVYLDTAGRVVCVEHGLIAV